MCWGAFRRAMLEAEGVAFDDEERVLMEEAFENAAAAAGLIVAGEMEAAMNEYNRKKKDE